MEYRLEIVIDESAKPPRFVIYTAELSDELVEFAERMKGMRRQKFFGYRDEETLLLDPNEIYSFFTQGKTVQVRTTLGVMSTKYRLYQLEDLLENTSFLRVSHSEIVNFDKVQSFQISISGTINLKFTDGEYAYVSRRNVKTIKEYLGCWHQGKER